MREREERERAWIGETERGRGGETDMELKIR